MSSFIWYTSTNGSNWTRRITPHKYKIEWEDLDKDSYRSVTTGDLFRNVIRRRWAKINLAFYDLTDSEASAIMEAVNREDVWFKFRSPAFGSGEFISFKGYVSKMSTETDFVDKGWNISFNVVQSEGADHQT